MGPLPHRIARVLRCHMILEIAARFHPVGPPAARLRHVLPAVDGDVCAVDERGLLRAEVNDQPGDFLGLSEPSEIVFTVTPFFATSSASDLVKPCMPAFAAA